MHRKTHCFLRVVWPFAQGCRHSASRFPCHVYLFFAEAAHTLKIRHRNMSNTTTTLNEGDGRLGAGGQCGNCACKVLLLPSPGCLRVSWSCMQVRDPTTRCRRLLERLADRALALGHRRNLWWPSKSPAMPARMAPTLNRRRARLGRVNV